VLLAIGAGVVPFPVIDFAALVAIQSNMIRELAYEYDEPFLKEVSLKLITSLAGKNFLLTTGPELLASMSKIIPGIGKIVGMVSMPVIAGAATYASGKVFSRHFATGEGLLTFMPEKVQAYYKEMFEEGEQIASAMVKKKHKKT
jgi:uncharacterized protein (DUF697 family)